MKKAWLTGIALCSILTICLAGCQTSGGDAPEASSSPSPKQTAAAKQEKKKFDVKILDSKMGKDYSGKKILIVSYEFTNHKEESQSFAGNITAKVFQNGVECSDLVISDEIDSKKLLNEVQPETPYQIDVGYELENMEDPVQIKVTDLFKTETYAEKEITLP